MSVSTFNTTVNPYLMPDFFILFLAHGQWTEWTSWSKCSITCGHNGTRTRQRYCSNPPPRYGGLSCIGSDAAEEYCPGNPSCPGEQLQ
jgi:hypothetical protein